MSKESIAIIGVGCRFPGGVADQESFWELLVEGRDVVGDVPADRWNIARYYDSEPGLPGKSIAKRGGFLDSIDQFDPQFFGISPREAPYVDPQHRLLLETAWEAIENAGVVLDFERGSDIGVFVGISHNDYQGIQGTPWEHLGVGPHSPTGSAHSIAANRISYCLNLRGPSMAMDTACSSALTAIYAACEHIRAGRGDAALAGGVTVIITPGGFIGFSQASMLSPEGKCKAFDAAADGFVRGEGVGMVLLKRLSAALRDGDPIQGIIVGTALNQDGHTNGISLPSAEAQARLVKEACVDAGVNPSDIGFVEAHGTGTAVGDPLEAHALSEALCGERPAEAPLSIGSVKTNVGHLETAAGMAGLLKAMLVLKHGIIPPSLHFREPSPHIDFDALKLRVVTRTEPLSKPGGKGLVGVNSFGFGGANAHVLLEEPPAAVHAHLGKAIDTRPWPLVLSARSEPALRANAANLSTWIDRHSSANGESPLLPDLTYTLGARRNHHPFRFTLVARDIAEAIAELQEFGAGQDAIKGRSGFSPRPEHPPRIAFVLSGQGPQWWGMGRELMREEEVFRATIERCAAAMKPLAFDLMGELELAEGESRIARTEIAQPAIFAMQVSLAALWRSWGVEPAAVVGHSVGEIAAACIAGVFSIEEGARIIVLRGRYMDQCARGEGTMLAVGMDEESACGLIARHDRTVRIAAYNGPRSLTLAGPRVSLEAMLAELEPQGIFARLVRVDHPFHHPMMEPAARALEAELAGMAPLAESTPLFSTVTGGKLSGADCTAEHWGNGVRNPVQFAPAMNALIDTGIDVWLEIGAHPALAHSIQECLGAREQKAPVISSARREHEHESLLEAAMDLHRAGVALNFCKMTPSRRLLTLPAYAWEKSRWWSEAPDWHEGRTGPAGRGLLELRLMRATPTWVARLDGRQMAYLRDHRVDNLVVFPAAAFVEMVLEAGEDIFEGRPFVVEDFEIRKPLILPENVGEVQIELTYEPAERTFHIRSKFERSASWSSHVLGSMRGDRTESAFANSAFAAAAQSPGMTSANLDDFYHYMSDLGLKYGEEFRAVRSLDVGRGESAGRVELSEKIAQRVAYYALHPVLLDGALHVFSAGAAAMEDKKSGMKLPVRFSRILFLKTPGSSSRVRAGVHECNDQFVEGRIELYNESGEPCVLVEGFRAISVAGARRGGATGTRNFLYHTKWEMAPSRPGAPLQPVALADLADGARRSLRQVLDLRGEKNIQTAMADGDDLAAAQLAKGLREMARHAGLTGSISSETLGVTPAMRAAFDRLAGNLCRRGILQREGAGYRLGDRFDLIAESATDVLRAFVSKHPGHAAEGMLCATTAGELGPILRSEKDAVQVLFAGSGAELLDQFYGEGLYTSHWLAAISAAVVQAAESLPEGRGLRILEVGAGTGGLAAHLLPLLQRGLHSYVFTDVSPAFFSAAGQKLAAYPEVEFKVLDLEKPGTEQGLEPESFDFVIGTNVLHAVKELRPALTSLHGLLAPGGSLVFMDVANPQLWTDLVFGLTPGWWRFTDRDLRTEHPLLERAQWETLLREVGFRETVSLPGLVGPEGEGQMAILARKQWEPANEQFEVQGIGPAEESWLVFAEESSLSAGLIASLRAAGARCRVVRPAGAFTERGDEYTIAPGSPEDWESLVEACSFSQPPQHLVYLWPLDVKIARHDTNAALMGTDALLHLAQAVGAIKPPANVRLDVVTRGAQPVGRDLQPPSPAQAALIGLMRVIRNEYPTIAARNIDLPLVETAGDGASLWRELLESGAEREVAIRGEARYVQRLDRGMGVQEQRNPANVALRLESRERGRLETLRFVPFLESDCGPGQVLIEVKAAGMNFRDVLKALALYPGEAPDAKIFGDEVAGIVKAVGDGVTHVRKGDRVFGLAVFGIASVTLARGGDIRPIPDGLSFEEAATLPVVCMTSWHALQNVARMRKGEVVLVHAGAGGVGMAAIQIAHYLGGEVIASAGNPVKRALLHAMGVKHVIDSRRGDFAEAVMEITNRRGVDVVINALAGEAIPMGLSCLAQFGRFIEIGKRDIYQNSRIPLWPMRKNASFHVVAMDAVFAGDESLTAGMLAQIAEMVEKGFLHPLPFRSFPATRVDAAFRTMAAGKHIGKVIVSFAEPFMPPRGEPLAPGFTVRADGTYLITGAFGGFGRIVAQWLANSGARHLLLAGRSGAATEEAQAFVAGLRDQGIDVQVSATDVSNPDDVDRLVSGVGKTGRPLRGVFHLAMVIDDAPLASLDRERMRNVMAPKALGAWLLHEATRDLGLDCFVMFSSVSSIFGNPAQGNYSAANAFLDSLAHHRRALGLPVLAVNWGVLGGAGYVARNRRVAEFLARQGTEDLSPREVISVLESSLAAGAPQVMAIRVDWARWRQFFRGMQENPLLERIFASVETTEGQGGANDLRQKIEGATAEELGGLLLQAVRGAIASVLRVKPESLRDDQPLTDLGLDSLMGVEIENSIEASVGVSLPPASLLRARTIGQIVKLIAEHLGAKSGQPAPSSGPPAAAADAAPEEIDLDGLSDEDIDALLSDESRGIENTAPAQG